MYTIDPYITNSETSRYGYSHKVYFTVTLAIEVENGIKDLEKSQEQAFSDAEDMLNEINWDSVNPLIDCHDWDEDEIKSEKISF